MGIIGIGVDIIEIERIKKAVSSKSGTFMTRYFTADENRFFEAHNSNPASIAANFAAKEAFVKALGTGFSGVCPSEVETLRDERGKPYINAYGAALEAADKLGAVKIHVSLSHSKEHAQAFVILEQ